MVMKRCKASRRRLGKLNDILLRVVVRSPLHGCSLVSLAEDADITMALYQSRFRKPIGPPLHWGMTN